MTKLNKTQRKDMLEELKKQEKLIEMDVLHFKDNDKRRQDGFQKTILAIQNIVNKKLYKACAPSLEIYFRDVWKISRAQVYRFLDCATVLNTLEGFKVRPSKERLCRSLKRHGKSPTNIRNLWTLVKMRADDREITSTLIGKCWEEIVNNGGEVVEDPIPKKKECKPRKPKTDIPNPATVVIPSSKPQQPKTKVVKPLPQINTALVTNMNNSFSSPSVMSVNSAVSQSNSSSLGTPLMNTAVYINNNNNTLNTPTTQEAMKEQQFYQANTPNQKTILQSLPTPTMTSSNSIHKQEGPNLVSINPNDLNTTTATAALSTTSTTTTNITPQTIFNNDNIANSNETKKTEKTAYPSPSANHVISQQQNEYGQIQQYPGAAQYVVKQEMSSVPGQKMNYPLGSVIVNPSPSSTPIVDTGILDTLPQSTQQVILSSNGYPSTTLQGQDPSNKNIQMAYIPQNQGIPSTTSPYQIMTNQSCILSPSIQHNQQLPSQGLTIQTNFSPIASYPLSQPQTPQTFYMNNNQNMIDTNNIIYSQPTPPKSVYPPLPNPLSMQPSQIVYTVPPTPAQNAMLSPPSQSPINYYNMTSEFHNGNGF